MVEEIVIPVGPGGVAAPGSDEHAPVVGPRAALDSPLADMRQRREKLIKALWLDLKVPRWEDDGGPEIWVRYGPVRPGLIQSAAEKRFKQKGSLGVDWPDYANADVLIDCCIGVFAKDGDNVYSLRPGEPLSDWTRFDPALADCLGIDTKLAVDTCLALYLTKADLTNAVNQLIEWSGEESARVEKDARGN